MLIIDFDIFEKHKRRRTWKGSYCNGFGFQENATKNSKIFPFDIYFRFQLDLFATVTLQIKSVEKKQSISPLRYIIEKVNERNWKMFLIHFEVPAEVPTCTVKRKKYRNPIVIY